MAVEPSHDSQQPTRLLPLYLKAGDDGLLCDAIMLCEVIGSEIQSISLRLAADLLRNLNDMPMSEPGL